MSAVIAFQCARKGIEKQKALRAENDEHAKHVHEAERALRKLEAAATVQELNDAVRRGERLQSYLPALEEALPEARSTAAPAVRVTSSCPLSCIILSIILYYPVCVAI